jgi:hypothetical protein
VSRPDLPVLWTSGHVTPFSQRKPREGKALGQQSHMANWVRRPPGGPERSRTGPCRSGFPAGQGGNRVGQVVVQWRADQGSRMWYRYPV